MITHGNMDYLNLSHNNIEFIHPSALRPVTILDISYNNLKHIPKYFHHDENEESFKSIRCGMYARAKSSCYESEMLYYFSLQENISRYEEYS